MSNPLSGFFSRLGGVADFVGQDFDVKVNNARIKTLNECRNEKVLAIAQGVIALAFTTAVVICAVGGPLGVMLGVGTGLMAMLYCYDKYQFYTSMEAHFKNPRSNISETLSPCNREKFKKNTILFGEFILSKSHSSTL